MARTTTRSSCRIAWVLAAAVSALVVASGCAAASPDGTDADGSGPVDLGNGRVLDLECRGSGSPTVLFISGTGGAADEWSELQPGVEGKSTFEEVSSTTRACAYDRPGTTDAAGVPTESTSVDQPTTSVQGADDLAALMAAAGEHGPFVLVGLSWGGMIAQQFARSHPDEVVGLVLLDAASAFLPETLTPEQWAAWMAVVVPRPDAPGAEVPAYEPSILALARAAPMAGIPVIVMSSDRPWDLQVTPGASTWPGWVAAQAALADSLDAEHITETESGHGLPLEQPALVTAAVVEVVAAVRAVG